MLEGEGESRHSTYIAGDDVHTCMCVRVREREREHCRVERFREHSVCWKERERVDIHVHSRR